MTPEEKRLKERQKHGKSWDYEKALSASGVVQSARDQVDVNVLMARYEQTGTIPQHVGDALWGAFDQALDLKSAMDQAGAAREAFGELPAKVREAADNNPVRFLEMLEDDTDLEVLADAGLEMSQEWADAREARIAAAAAATPAPPNGGENPTE